MSVAAYCLEPAVKARHKIKILNAKTGLVVCACGYHYRDPKPGAYRGEAMLDKLFDLYNLHRNAKMLEAPHGPQAHE